ncbi:MAG: type IX secretion system protein PorQ [Porphyromonadaceae bacterium]|nr:type IX secretion system protein PorQ [Porphyromonadaceae bacterium]
MSKKYFILVAILLINTLTVFSQAGRGVYRFLELPVSSRAAAVGGYNVSIQDNDVNFALMNPALLTEETHGVIGLNMANYLADIKFGSAIYGHNFGDENFFSFGVQYVDLGHFAGYDELGQYTEDFTAKDIALHLSYARPLNDFFTVGATLKPIFSAYERYTSVGLAMDFGVNYNTELFSAGLVVKNAGVQLKGYYSDVDGQHREPLPFDIQLGISKKFEHAPLRISVTANNLHRWNVASYQTTNKQQTNLDGTIIEKNIGFFDMAFRHLVFGAEFVPSKNFYVAAGYNHRRNKEMSIDGFKSLAGFSFGAGVKLYKFQVGFGLTQFQAGNNAYQFSISTNLGEFVSL